MIFMCKMVGAFDQYLLPAGGAFDRKFARPTYAPPPPPTHTHTLWLLRLNAYELVITARLRRLIGK